MIQVNIAEVKAKLSEYLERVEQGERVVICKRNQPVAELRPVEPARTERRPLGGLEGQITILPSFFDPLPDEVLNSFDEASIFPSGTRVAESSATYGARKSGQKPRLSKRRRS